MASQRRRNEIRELVMAPNDSSPLTATGRDDQSAEDAVRARAYELYEHRGGEPGHDWDDWLQAEREFRREADSRE